MESSSMKHVECCMLTRCISFVNTHVDTNVIINVHCGGSAQQEGYQVMLTGRVPRTGSPNIYRTRTNYLFLGRPEYLIMIWWAVHLN